MSKAKVRPIDYRSCGLYTPGHQVHMIQAKRAWEHDPAKYRTGTLLRVDEDGWIAVEVEGEVLRFWNHDPARARECFALSGGCLGLPGWGLLHAPYEDGRYCICVSSERPTPCVPPPWATTHPAQLVDQLNTYSGFMTSGAAIVRDLSARTGTSSPTGAPRDTNTHGD